jgi:hypothetical protein
MKLCFVGWRSTLDNILLPLEIVEPYCSSFSERREEYAGHWCTSRGLELREHIGRIRKS